MSYPPIRYHGSDGERSATLRRAGDPPDLVYRTGTTVDYLATGASTDGLFGLYRWSMPGKGGPGPHFHRTLTESSPSGGPWLYVATSMGYAVVYAAVTLVVAAFIFRRRDFL